MYAGSIIGFRESVSFHDHEDQVEWQDHPYLMWGVKVQPDSESAEKLQAYIFLELPTSGIHTSSEDAVQTHVEDTKAKQKYRGDVNELSQTQPQQPKMQLGRKNQARRGS